MRSSVAPSLDLPVQPEGGVLPALEVVVPEPFVRDWRLRRREQVAEAMDAPDLDEASHRRALNGIARLNLISGSVGHVWRCVRRIARQRALKRLTLIDVATGSGDVPIALSRLARRDGIELRAVGVDVSGSAIDYAKVRAAERGEAVEFVQADAISEGLPGKCDVAICSLFLHHLDEADAVRLLRAMNASATQFALVNDLVRSPWTLAQVWAASRIVTRSPVVHFDGPASVRAAFTIEEALDLARRAGLSGVEARSAFPCRYLMTWSPAK